LKCINPDNEFQFFRSWSEVCKKCKGSAACEYDAALSFVKDCSIEFNPELLICMECKHHKLCKSYHSNNPLHNVERVSLSIK